jgi:hypothetical protein
MKRNGAKSKGVARPPKSRKAAQELSHLYETDETAWLERSSELIKQRRYEELDYQNLSEFLLDMATSDRRQVMSRLTVLLAHKLKWDHQPRKRSRSWEMTLVIQRQDLEQLLESRTLKNYAAEILAKAYAKAIVRAAVETGLPKEAFPHNCPYSLEELLQEK